MGSTRYIVDERVGAVAVRDTGHPQYDPGCCLANCPDVQKSWQGKHYKNSRQDGAVWYVPQASISAAVSLCRKLNERSEDKDEKE